jgi:two-component system chemotaxis sensor kinase CheA
MFTSVDRLSALVELLRDPNAKTVEFESVVEEITRLLSAPSQTPAATPDVPTIPAAQPEVAPQAEEAPKPATAFEAIEDDAEIPDKYLAIFVDEAGSALDECSEALSALSDNGGCEQLTRLLATAHKVKGAAASIGLNRAAKLTHLMEDLLQGRAECGQALAPTTADILLACVDGFRQYVDDLKAGKSRFEQFPVLAAKLQAEKAHSSEPQPASQPMPQPSPLPAAPVADGKREVSGEIIAAEIRARLAAMPTHGKAMYVGRVEFDAGLNLAGLKAQLIYEKLANLGDIRHFNPPEDQLDKLDRLEGVTFALLTDKASSSINECLKVGGVAAVAVEPLVADAMPAPAPIPPQPAPARPVAREKHEDTSPAAAPATAPTPAAESGTASRPPQAAADKQGQPQAAADKQGRPTETLRVDVERLDELMNLSGQLVINKARFAQIGGELTELLDRLAHEPGAVSQVRGRIGELFEAIHQLDRVSDGIQQAVMGTRMVPIGPLFQRFKRVIRDVTRSNGKSVRLVIRGEKTELDKRMIDELADPLIHLVRNAVDHGIETPEGRQAAGKPAEGTITLDAFHRGNSILIRVTDDGRGLDSDRILRKCLDRGLLTEAQAQGMTRSQIYQMIWEPGVSTAEKVTEISGRGMGMDIVKSKIEQLSGSAEMDSEPGRGTTFTIKLPLTLAILPGLMVEIDGDTFVLPMESVREIVSAKRNELATIHGMPTVRVRDRVLSFVRLGETFTWHGRRAPQAPIADEPTLVIVGEAQREVGLAVQRVIGEDDVVIKSVSENYRNVPGIAGASILGDGRVALILDVPTLIEMSCAQVKK